MSNFQGIRAALRLMAVAALSLLVAFGVSAQTVRYIHTDGLGSPVLVTDKDRNVVELSEYEPYGRLLNRPVTNGPGYTGHVVDASTGLTYMQQRYYDQGIGLFLSVDPVAINSVASNFNRYWYANNNPYKSTDPDGRQTIPTENKIGTDNPETIQAFHQAQGEFSVKFLKIAAQIFLSQFSDGPGGAIAAGPAAVMKGVEGVTMSRAILKEAGGTVKGSEVTFRLPSGRLTRADTVAAENGKIGIIESKNGPTAALTRNQKEAQAAIERGDALTPVGKNAEAAGFETGKPVKLDYYKVDHFNK